ncbi:MAG: MiaB/RimO family radical SAM methylthiotransferase, partial [Chloroflexota bacterium]|nr:MiaB/RimO family radical SAM methylthiotransferase [Chloroflexota bacterium]
MSKIEGTRIALDTVGCKLNQAETELLARELVQAGYRVVSPAEGADVYILNTCTVTQMADSKCRHLLRMARRRNPAARLVVTGCYAERAAEALAKLEEVDLVLGNEDKPHLLRRLAERGFLTIPISTQGDSPDAFRTRAFIKIQDGCHNFCAYCIVPLVRRNEVSVPVGRVTAEIRQRVGESYKELVLTGTEVGSYRFDGMNLTGLLARILAETGITRLRLSSLQPQEISPELVSLWRDERLCRHFHLSLQSGSDSVLRRMKRRYSASEYASAVSLIRDNISGVAITT